MDWAIVFFLCGDFMIGRGIDQVLPYSVEPTLHEPYMTDARQYVELARQKAAHISETVDAKYIWGDALKVLEKIDPAVRIINLETALTTSDDYQRDKGIHYRAHPKNVACITAAGIDVCVLANNHVLDWGEVGLHETLNTLAEADIKTAGAGLGRKTAQEPVVLHNKKNSRILVYAFGMPSSGVARDWAARPEHPGVNYLAGLSREHVRRVTDLIKATSRDEDLIVFSVHWGGNWGYEIPSDQVEFAHALIDEAGVDIVHGHSSHHVKGLEVYHNRLILYGCGDFLNDYEGIGGRERYRADLTFMYLPVLDSRSGELKKLQLAPMRIRNFQLQAADDQERSWLRRTLDEQSERFGVKVAAARDDLLEVHWKGSTSQTE